MPIRLQHDPHKPVGHVVRMHLDDDNQRVVVGGIISDEQAKRKVEDGTLTMFSIGGEKVSTRHRVDENGEQEVDCRGRPVNWFVGRPQEVSLVDLGCCSSCNLTYFGKAYELHRTGTVPRIMPVWEGALVVMDHRSHAKALREHAQSMRKCAKACEDMADEHERIARTTGAPGDMSGTPRYAPEDNSFRYSSHASMTKGWENPDDFDLSGGLRRVSQTPPAERVA